MQKSPYCKSLTATKRNAQSGLGTLSTFDSTGTSTGFFYFLSLKFSQVDRSKSFFDKFLVRMTGKTFLVKNQDLKHGFKLVFPLHKLSRVTHFLVIYCYSQTKKRFENGVTKIGNSYHQNLFKYSQCWQVFENLRQKNRKTCPQNRIISVAIIFNSEIDQSRCITSS